MTPYIITTRRPMKIEPYKTRERNSNPPSPWSRRAVLTPEKARAYAKDECIASEAADIAAASAADGIEYDRWDHRYAPFEAQCESLPESGGTVGPLPDGTEIKVEPATWIDVIDAIPGADWPEIPEHDGDEIAVEIIDAYNARST